MSEARKTFWDGVRAEIPLLIGVFPFGMIYGALALDAGLSRAASQMMSSIVFAGSAQFVTAQLVHDAAPGLVIILTIAVVNLRHMLYSASLAPYLKNLSLKWKVLLSYLLTDEAYAPSVLKYEETGVKPFSHWFVLGAGLHTLVHLAGQHGAWHFPRHGNSRKLATGFCPAPDLHCHGHARPEKPSDGCGSRQRGKWLPCLPMDFHSSWD